MDARDFVRMRYDKRMRDGLENRSGHTQRIGSFERFTKVWCSAISQPGLLVPVCVYSRDAASWPGPGLKNRFYISMTCNLGTMGFYDMQFSNKQKKDFAHTDACVLLRALAGA